MNGNIMDGFDSNSKLIFNSKIKSNATEEIKNILDVIEKSIAELKQAKSRRKFEINLAELQTLQQADFIKKILGFLYGMYVEKYFELLSEVVISINNERFLTFGLAARTLLETSATLRHYNKKLQDIADSAKDKDNFSVAELNELALILDKHSRGGRFDWFRFWTSNRKDMAENLVNEIKNKSKKNDKVDSSRTQTNPDSINVQTAINKWGEDSHGVQLAYAFFCELVHPNLGSNFLVMGVGNGNLHVGGDTKKVVARSIAAEGIRFLGPVLKQALNDLAVLLYWAALHTKGDRDDPFS
ncbi:MAG: hypothetical protein WCK81_12500 [Betaproteobacteria bacterium]